MDEIDILLQRGVDAIYPSREALEKFLRSGKKLRLYQGFDPTGPQLHIGHAVALRKLRQFQKLGHHVIFLIGDFTAMIGDPSGKTTARKILTKEEVLENAKSYKDQAGKILDFTGENPVEVKFNSEWLLKINAIEFLEMAHNLTYQQVIERDMFQKRIKEGQDLFMNEFLYPVLQGYDSVAMDIDLEIGGTDQMFNMMMGRKLMRNILKKEKFVMTVPLLTDSLGNKIGKTEGNVIGLTDAPADFYGKIMSLGDDAIIPCFRLLTDMSEEEITGLQNHIDSGENPMVGKKKLAYELTKQFNTESDAASAQTAFEETFQKREVSEDTAVPFSSPAKRDRLDLLVASGAAASKSEARRLLEQGAVELNGQKVLPSQDLLTLAQGDIIRVGKKTFLKIRIV